MPLHLQIILIVGAVLYLLLILSLLKRNKLTVRYAVLWLISGVLLLLFACVPYIVYVLRDWMQIEMPSNMVFLMLFAFVLLILLSLTVAVSERTEKQKQLAQKLALLEKRVRDLENAQNSAPQAGKTAEAPAPQADDAKPAKRKTRAKAAKPAAESKAE